MWLLGLADALERLKPEVIHLHEAFTLPVVQFRNGRGEITCCF